MLQPITILALFAIFTLSCKDKPKPKHPKNFISLEISYTDGWTTALSFLVDSNGVFFSPATSDSIKYGILPDSILEIINASLLEIRNDKTIKSKDDGCLDCPVLAVKAIILNDTLNVHQVGEISPRLWALMQTLKEFVGKPGYSRLHSVLFLQTREVVSAPPSPLNTNKFSPPNNDKEKQQPT